MFAGACALVCACATESFPSKRPLTGAEIAAMSQTDLVLDENNEGVGKSWFMTDSSAAGAQYGLIGALVTATMDAIMNAGPARRAKQAANEVAEVVLAEKLNDSLHKQLDLDRAAADSGSGKVTIGSVTTIQKISHPAAPNDAVEVTVNYLLSEDASALRIVATASYENSAMPYHTPYPYKQSPPKAELTGPAYRNTFTYESAHLPLPVLTPELKQRLIESVQRAYADTEVKFPAEQQADQKRMNKELVEANDDKLSKSEASIFLVREWLKSDGSPLIQEIEKAHAFIAKYVLVDVNDTAVPRLTGEDRLVETAADGRSVRMVGSGVASGSYVSSPGALTEFTTYGNAAEYPAANMERIKSLRAQAKLDAKAK